MNWLIDVDWSHILQPDTPLLEIFLRGTLVYLGIFFLLRVILKRESGSVGITDLLLVVLLADAAQNAMADSYTSVTDGMLLVSTIIFWSYALDWLSYHSPVFARLTEPQPIQLVNAGQILWRNLRKELITEKELMAMLRQQGIENLNEIKAAYIEHNGQISVIKHQEEG
jgi:uncharacterized membrane protein YcaP (DUF421 family)